MGLTSRAALLCTAGFTAVALGGTSSANATGTRQGERSTQSRAAGAPLLAIIALAQQRVTVYGASGKMMEGPVSTGATGHETPAGIYSILEKEEEHHSNLYDDASMPFMQRLTWTGISMHAGVLPGYPASHGCTRLSYGFAQKFYQVTKPGMRVVIVREDIIPAEIEQPELFNRPAPEVSPSGINATDSPSEADIHTRLAAIKEAKLAKAEAAKKRELEAQSAAANKAAQAASAAHLAEAAAANLARMETALDAGERMRETVFNRTGNAEPTRTAAAAKIQAARLQLERAKTEAQAKKDAAVEAEEEAKLAAAMSDEAAEAAETARENAWPISIFISRQAQRLYIRRGREPVFEGPVTIRNPDEPIGTFVFTALSYTGTPGRLGWNVVSMYKNATAIEPYSDAKREPKQRREPKPADVAGARNAMQRLVIPQAALDHISGTLLTGSSLIISDEGTSSETGKDTDFIVFMSGEPKGGAAFRSPVIADAAGEGRRAHGQTRRTSSSSSRSRHQAAGAARRGREFSPFSSLFGF
ncbi:MAG TPA: L,D-transpeptidase family protein [Geobacterales bacterium]|nr:L,D-transpeptidase family protein [Geobacterales bacterium]